MNCELLSLFQRVSNFNDVMDQYISIAPLTRKLYLIGGRELAAGIRLPPNTEIIDSTGYGLEMNWVIIVLAQDEGCALIAEEFEAGRYRGFFTTNTWLSIDIVLDFMLYWYHSYSILLFYCPIC
jgi:hypothetical protein